MKKKGGKKSRWTVFLQERIFSSPAAGADGRGPVWGNPRNLATSRYQKLPYGVHYDPEEGECRNVVLGNGTKTTKIPVQFSTHESKFCFCSLHLLIEENTFLKTNFLMK